MLRSACLLLVLVVGAFCSSELGVAASRTDGGLRDRVYVSPSWGYSVRWYDGEWVVDEESSSAGTDSLWLSDELGIGVGFEGRRGYGGDARACVDDRVGLVEGTPTASNIVVLQDESGRPQKFFHPWRSWVLLIVGYQDSGQVVDRVVYIDCRTLVPDEAVFIRYLIAPAESFSNELEKFDVLNAALPRSAWAGNPIIGLSEPGLDREWAPPPLPVDSIWPWVYPDDPKLLATDDFIELGMMTQVDGDMTNNRYVVTIENSGQSPLLIDPAGFVITNVPDLPQRDLDLEVTRANWSDGAEPGPRMLDVGSWATVTLEFPTPAEERLSSVLVYRDMQLSGGEVALDCTASCGYGGGGSRPKIRISR